MGNRTTSTRRAGASTSRSGQAVTVFSGNGFSVTGGAISSTSTITLGVVVPGETSSNSAVTPASGGATITAITKTDSSFTPIANASANISPSGYFTLSGDGFENNAFIFIGANTVSNVYYSTTELRANLLSLNTTIADGSYNLTYFNPNTRKTGIYSSGITIESVAPIIDYLVVAGGGGGGSGGGGGGGAGGLLQSTSVTLQKNTTYTITVGAGGAGGVGVNQTGSIGANSSISGSGISTITSERGGAGAGPANTPTYYSGGSGGGAARAGPYTGGAGVAGQGYKGGDVASPNNNSSAGGGGAGGVGQNRVSNSTAGAGGVGATSSITGTSIYYAGGGGGSGYSGGGFTTPGAGGNGGGGAGGSTTGNSGTTNLGGGGGAGSYTSVSSDGGSGGSGVVILRFLSEVSVISTTGSPTITTDGIYKVYKFTQSGSITF